MYNKDLKDQDHSIIVQNTISQCFSCNNKQCSRAHFVKNNILGKDLHPNNPGVLLTSWYCKNWRE